MIILDATTKTLEIKLAGAVTTNQCPFVASWVDITTTTLTPGENDGVSNNTTAVTAVAAPAASTQRQVKFLSVKQADTVNATIIVQYNNNGTIREIFRATLAADVTLFFDDTHGFYCVDGNGQLLTAGSAAAAGVAADIIAYYDGTSAPSGWAALAAARGFTIVGMPSGGTQGGTVGSALTDLQDKTHTHTGPSHQHTVPLMAVPASLKIAFNTTPPYGSGSAFTGSHDAPAASANATSRTGMLVQANGTGATGTAATSNVIPYIQYLPVKKS